MWFVTRRRYEDELAAAKHEIRRQRERAEAAEERAETAEFNREQILQQLASTEDKRRRLARWLADEKTANRRLHDRNLELGRRVSVLAESDLEYAAHLERRVARLKKVGKRIVAAWAREQRRANHLQERLDGALGLNTPAVRAGRHWQATRTDGGRKGVAS
jgi:chromosome segregation ATPase